ncbi:MAG: exopolysaccharide Pel transporter PelG [Verrucomicrobiales bacterium]
MAGIGFELRKMLEPRSGWSLAHAYLYAGIISSGPWIISIASIALLYWWLTPIFTQEQRTLFTSAITHAYALGLIITGPIQLVVTRYASDRLSQGQPHDIMPSCVGALTLSGILTCGVGIAFFGFGVPESMSFRLAAIALLTSIGMIFLASNHLTGLREYRGVALSFLGGYAATCAAAIVGARWGVSGALWGFALGHLGLLILLVWRLQRELGGSPRLADLAFLGYFRKFPQLALCGFFYNVGIWIDKWLFWSCSNQHQQVSGLLQASPSYDIAIYLSLLSIVPGITVFFLKLETEFAEQYEGFFQCVNGRGSLDRIRGAKDDMVDTLSTGFTRLLTVQGLFTAGLILFATPVGNFLGIGVLEIGVFRVTLVGALLLVLFLAMLTIMFYLDDRNGAMLCSAIFAVSNGVLSLVTLRSSEAWYGYGFVVAAGLALLVSMMRVNQRMARFEYHVFHPGGH